MQVWSNQGELVYERKLLEPVANWSISTDKLLFQEEVGSSTVCVVKLSLDSRATLYEIELPQEVLEEHADLKDPTLRRQALARQSQMATSRFSSIFEKSRRQSGAESAERPASASAFSLGAS